MVTNNDILAVLRTIDDPEMPISIVDLGIVDEVRIGADVEHNAAVEVDILPTFVGCPALDMIRSAVEDKVRAMEGVADVTVNFRFDPPWSVDRISDAGRESLRTHGVTVPERGCCSLATADTNAASTSMVRLSTSAIHCPYCGSSQTHMESRFGPTRCRMIYYCDACRNSFEHMKQV